MVMTPKSPVVNSRPCHSHIYQFPFPIKASKTNFFHSFNALVWYIMAIFDWSFSFISHFSPDELLKKSVKKVKRNSLPPFYWKGLIWFTISSIYKWDIWSEVIGTRQQFMLKLNQELRSPSLFFPHYTILPLSE